MDKSVKKQNFLQGAAMLAVATAVVKLIGAFYKLPLNETIQPLGYSYFTTAYDIYSVLLMISSAGLPVAMSKLISQYSALGHYNQVRQVYKTSRTIFLVLGVFSILFMMLGCKALANAMNQADAWPAILCLGPSALFMVLMSAYRGFFQGQGDMRPTSNSQMLEAVFKLIVGLGAAFAIMKLSGDVSWAAAGAILGVTISCLISVFYLRHRFVPAYKAMPQTNEPVSSFGQTAKQLLGIAIPITIGAAGLSLLTVFETGLYMDRLVYLVESNQYMGHLVTAEVNAQDAAGTIKGIYNMSQTIFNMPCAFIVPITVSVIPAVTSFLTLCQDDQVRSTEESATRVTGLMSLPCAVGLFLLGEPVMALLGELRIYQANHAISCYVFAQEGSSEPIHPQTPTRYLKTFSERCGIPGLHPHKLRHSFASVAITNGADIASVSEKLGHSDKAVTLRMYTHADQESMKRASNIFRDALKENPKDELKKA